MKSFSRYTSSHRGVYRYLYVYLPTYLRVYKYIYIHTNELYVKTINANGSAAGRKINNVAKRMRLKIKKNKKLVRNRL